MVRMGSYRPCRSTAVAVVEVAAYSAVVLAGAVAAVALAVAAGSVAWLAVAAPIHLAIVAVAPADHLAYH